MVRRREPHADPLERAERAVRELRDADDWDEPTAPAVHVHVTPQAQPSGPEIPPRAVVRDLLAVLRELPPGHRVFVALAALGLAAALAAGGYVVWR